MRFSSPSSTFFVLCSLCHHFSSKTQLPSLSKIPWYCRLQAVKQGQEVLTDYLHSTKALPFTYAEHISKNSRFSLFDLISKVHFSSSDFPKTLMKFLWYNPINEFVFFYESIGIPYRKVTQFLKPNVHFFSDDSTVLDSACALAGFGFPWDRLGTMYEEECSIFEEKPDIILARLNRLLALGFTIQQVVGVCLIFPYLLKGEIGISDETNSLLNDIKKVFTAFCLGSSMEENTDTWFELCRKTKLFYDLGVAKGKVGEMLVKGKNSYVDCTFEVLTEKIEFFCRLGVDKEDVGLVLLSKPEIFSLVFNNRVISLSGFLKHFGVENEKLESVSQQYSYVFGRHKMLDVPSAVRALGLNEWFFNRIKCGYSRLMATYDLSSPDDELDDSYVRNLEKIKSSRTSTYKIGKLNFLHGIGFGETNFTIKILRDLHGSPSDLQERFDYLLSEGIEYPKLCKMISCTPKSLNQEIHTMKKKIKFLRNEIGLPLEYLETYPAYLLYNLENRIKPRYKFHVWLTEQGLCGRKYSLLSTVALSQKGFLTQLSCIHPTAPQLWLDRCANQRKIRTEPLSRREEDIMIDTVH